MSVGDLKLFQVYYNDSASRRDHVVLFVTEVTSGQEPFKPGFEIAEMRAFDPEDLPPNIQKSSRDRIREVIDGRPSSTIW